MNDIRNNIPNKYNINKRKTINRELLIKFFILNCLNSSILMYQKHGNNKQFFNIIMF